MSDTRYSNYLVEENYWEDIANSMKLPGPDRETEIGPKKIVIRRKQFTKIKREPSEVSSFLVQYLKAKTKNAKEKGREEISILSKFFLNMAETVETFPKIYQIEIKSQVFELVSKYERQVISESERSDMEVQLDAMLPGAFSSL